jgi:hypothetical protein
VAGGGDGRLHDEDVGAGFLRDLGEALGALGIEETTAGPPPFLISWIR